MLLIGLRACASGRAVSCGSLCDFLWGGSGIIEVVVDHRRRRRQFVTKLANVPATDESACACKRSTHVGISVSRMKRNEACVIWFPVLATSKVIIRTLRFLGIPNVSEMARGASRSWDRAREGAVEEGFEDRDEDRGRKGV